MRENYRDLRVAVLGGGTVGAQVAHRLLEGADELGSRSGAGLALVGVAVRDIKAPRSAPIPAELLTTDAHSLILQADIVVELMGGIEPAKTLILEALRSGADVVTANKALLAEHGPELLMRPLVLAPSFITKRQLRQLFRLFGRCVTRWQGIASQKSWASLMARPISSWMKWTRRD